MRHLNSLALSLMLMAVPAFGQEYAVMTALPIATVPDCPAFGVLTEPAGWRPGDAAVVIVGDRSVATLDHARLVGALIDEETAVFEVDGPGDCAAAGLGALEAAVQPGLAVVIGYGAAGPAALRITAAPLSTRVIAAVALTPVTVAFAGGAPVAAAERLDQRWPLFCAALGSVAPMAGHACRGAIRLPAPPRAFAERR